MQQTALSFTLAEKMDDSSMESDIAGLVEDFSQRLGAVVPSSERDLAEKFVRLFYTNPARDTVTRMKPEDIVQELQKIWDFYKQRPVNEPKIRIYRWTPDEDNAFAERIIIDIVNHNYSFGLDSIYGLLSRLNTKPRLSFHPIFKANRDKDGFLTELSQPKSDIKNAILESIIHIEITDNISDELMDALEAELPGVLKAVERANLDWQPMRQKAQETINDLENYGKQTKFELESLPEVIKFVNWVKDEHFTFLGYCNYDLLPDGKEKIASRVAHEEALGVLKDRDLSSLQTLFAGIAVDAQSRGYIFDKFPIIINKTSVISKVHRSVRMDCIGVRRYDAHGNVVGIRIFVGLFTSVAYDSSARDIPLLRTKIERIVDKAGFTFEWHDGKALIHILDSLPRDELFQASIAELTDIGLKILRLQERRRLKFFVRRDQFNRFLSCLVYIPRDRFDTDLCDRIATILRNEFEGTTSPYKAQYGELPFARVHYTVHSANGLKDNYDVDHIENLLIAESKSWADDLKATLMDTYKEVQSAKLYRKYKKAFDKGYQERYRGAESLDDITEVEKLYEQGNFRVRINNLDECKSTKLKLKLYHLGAPLALSDVLPILENLDLRVLSEVPFEVAPIGEEESIWIHDFLLESRGGCIIDIEETCRKFEDTLIRVRKQEIENDGFNRLVLRVGLNWRECAMFRAYAKYIRLIGLPFSKAYLSNTIVRNPEIVRDLNRYFILRFCPQNHNQDEEKTVKQRILDGLNDITSADDDRVLRLYLTVINATVRTNFFQNNAEGAPKDYISFKISSQNIEELPKPRPVYEIFVYSSYMEGIHLRGGKVARGGIRWSDRQEDYRTEVLNLVKAQMVKNTVIVPVGSKGGFIVKQSTDDMSREDYMKIGITCYRSFIRGLLDLTDNLKEGAVIHPDNVIRHDDDDTYLVVAADKGTASFSDYANEISNEYGFWLGDAFASGGSVGYDHKKMAITARGAWESVKRHFREMGKNIQNEDFTVIGIGDMSGDVFGNGMLLSEHIRLQAAFNHLHIFVDPNPDAAKSFKERKRLFELDRSSWSDYDVSVLSKGAKIYNRKDKNIKLTPEIQEMLGCEATEMRPDALIKLILKHKAELLWFGGIGTYVKASTEGINDVGDRSNDAVRINARDLRVRVIAEGANLGLTQQARIEFERVCDGKINTDAIDNSAGVACSDREVNIKILFNDVIQKGKISLEERNKMLVRMTDDVAKLVLRDNYMQPQIITDMAQIGTKNFDQQLSLLRHLENKGVLDRSVEYLPDDAKIEEYQNTQMHFSRAEFAVILGYAKIYFYDQVLASDIPDDPLFESRLASYFPELIQEKFPDAIHNHTLRREIIATYAVNVLVNRMGPSFVNLAMTTTKANIEDVFKAFFTVCEVFQTGKIWDSLETLDCNIREQKAIHYRLMVHKIIKRTALWLLRYYPMQATIAETAKVLGVGIESFLSNMEFILPDDLKKKIELMIKQANLDGLPNHIAHRLAILGVASTSPDIILIANETKFTVPEVAELYFQVAQRYHFNYLRDVLESPTFNTNVWDRRLSASMIEDLYSYQSDLTINILQHAEAENIKVDDHFETVIERWEHAHRNIIDSVRNTIKEGQIQTTPDLTIIGVIMRDLRVFSGV